MKLFVRVAAIIERDGAILTHRSEQRGVVYYALPGGHLEAGETTVTCLERELMEEFGIEVVVGRLLYLAEGMFLGGRKQPKPKHEIVFYYRATLCEPDGVVRSREEPRIYAHWLPLAGALEQLFPAWLRLHLPEAATSGWNVPTSHIIADERDPEHSTVQRTELSAL